MVWQLRNVFYRKQELIDCGGLTEDVKGTLRDENGQILNDVACDSPFEGIGVNGCVSSREGDKVGAEEEGLLQEAGGDALASIHHQRNDASPNPRQHPRHQAAD